MTKADDISVGDFIVVTKDNAYPEVEYGDGFIPKTVIPLQYSGRPVEVVAIGLPFLVIKNVNMDASSALDTLDIRRYSVQKVQSEYIQPFIQKDYINKTGVVIEKDREKETSRGRICPECGGHLVETRLFDVLDIVVNSRHKYNSWGLKCKTCTFVGAKVRE